MDTGGSGGGSGGHESRAGHRFNRIIEALPHDALSAIPFEKIYGRLKALGDAPSREHLALDLNVLVARNEISYTTLPNDERVYWALPRGLFESRKRSLLMRLHNMRLTEKELEELERIVVSHREPPA